jgi:hypothetical protein
MPTVMIVGACLIHGAMGRPWPIETSMPGAGCIVGFSNFERCSSIGSLKMNNVQGEF